MELRVLRNVVALAEEQHFGRAAQRLHLAQSALSQQVKQLEVELGVSLFDRSTRHVDLTEAGGRFLEHARSILGAADRATADMRATAEGRRGAVSVGLVGTATYDVLPRVARAMRAELPDIDLTLRGEQLNPTLLEGVVTGRLDLALVRPGPLVPDELDVRTLRTERLVAVLPADHPRAGGGPLDLSLLAGETFVVHPSGARSSIHQLVLSACRGAGFDPAALVEINETATLAVFVAAGIGVALVPEPVRSLRLDGVVYVDLVDPPTIDLALVSHRARRSPAVRVVEEVVRRCVAGPTPLDPSA